MFDDILLALDLKHNQILIYNFLLENIQSTAGNLSKKVKLPRATVYDSITKLKEKSLVQEISNKKAKLFIANKPQNIKLALEQKIETLKTNCEDFDQKILEYTAINPDKLTYPKFEIFYGEQELKNAMFDLITTNNSMTLALWPINTMLETLSPEFFNYLNKVRIRNNIYTKALWPNSKIPSTSQHPYLGSGEGFLREIRILPKGIEFSMGFWIYENKVVFISSKIESFGFIIESQDLVGLLTSQFNFLWSKSKPIKESKGKTVEKYLASI
jgi:sugar-specific transcriptional regulator TrmB